MRSHPKKRQVVQPDAAPRGDSSYMFHLYFSKSSDDTFWRNHFPLDSQQPHPRGWNKIFYIFLLHYESKHFVFCFPHYETKTLHIFVSTLWNGDTKRELNNKCSGLNLQKKKVFILFNVKCFTICNTYLAGIWPLVLGPQFFWQCWDAFCKNDVFIVLCSGQPLRTF